MTTFSDIIDNRDLNLKDEILSKLDGSEKVKFAVGYLYLSGFYQIADKLENLQDAKILIGSNINRDLMEALAESVNGDEELQEVYDSEQYQRPVDRNKVKDKVRERITANLQALPHTAQRQQEIRKLVELIAQKKVKVKVYTRHPLHAKAYIFKYKQEIATAAASEGIGVIGSSNLTISGFYHNTELNTYVRGQKNYEEMNAWFDRLWAEAVPFEDTLKELFEESWALKTVNPYDIYILTLYHLSKASIERQTEQIWFWENPDYMDRLVSRFKKMKDLYPFQKVAIMQGYQWVNKYNGVFISDVVGLGKTYIGSGILRQLHRRALIVSPPGLIGMWTEFMEKFEVDAKIISRGLLYNGVYNKESQLYQYRDREVVLIDESHHFRNDDTKMYRELQPFLAGKKVILMTATPQNTSVWNIYNQIKLFNQSEENIFLNRYEEPHLRNLFKKVEKGEYALPDLLKHIVIRRTRKHIRKFYADDNFQIDFPKRQLQTIKYDINETYQRLYDTIRKMLRKLCYARYDLWEYVRDEKKEIEPYVQLKKVTGTLRVFHKIRLFKRLESSIFAFRQSVNNLYDIHEKFLTIIEKKNIVPAGELIQDRIYRYDLDEIWEKIEDLTADYRSEDFNIDDLVKDLKHDLKILGNIKEYLSGIPENNDTKYDVLLGLIEDLKKNRQQEKILIFSEYADTVKYLYKRLQNSYHDIALIHGGTEGNDKKICAFAPVANDYEGKDVINLMVASDVLSEGHNLQDCSAVINYDLHWNPVRLIQRAGRVDRIGSVAETIWIENFLPVDEVEKEINLQKILERRITEIHEHIGEDERILTGEENLNEGALYAIYDQTDIDTLEQEEEKDFTPEEAEIIIRNLMRDKPEYMALLEKIQLGLRSSKRAQTLDGTYAFFRSGDFVRLLVRQSDGIIEEDFANVLGEIRCEPDELELTVDPSQENEYYSDLMFLKQHFETFISRENQINRIEPEVRKAVNRIRTMARSRMDQEIFQRNVEKTSGVLNVYFPHHLVSELKRINKTEKNDDRWFEEILNLYSREELSQIPEPEEPEQRKPIEFICGEILTSL
ncbi:MAG: helicase-related protein [bacterium]